MSGLRVFTCLEVFLQPVMCEICTSLGTCMSNNVLVNLNSDDLNVDVRKTSGHG
jgi:hypothetical protein